MILPLESSCQIIGQADDLERRAEDELPRVQDEGFLTDRFDQ